MCNHHSYTHIFVCKIFSPWIMLKHISFIYIYAQEFYFPSKEIPNSGYSIFYFTTTRSKIFLPPCSLYSVIFREDMHDIRWNAQEVDFDSKLLSMYSWCIHSLYELYLMITSKAYTYTYVDIKILSYLYLRSKWSFLQCIW